jgi:Uma2 family endonuclease
MTTSITESTAEQLQQPYYTPEEYLELEEQAEYKHEYRDGIIVPMTGGTTNHNEIASNFCTYLKVALKGQNYRVFIGDIRLWIPRPRQYTYPDLMVVEGKPIYEGKGTTTITNPLLIAEVLSKSTQDYDRGTKFTYYRSIPQFREYVLIDQYRFAIERFAKNKEGQWVLTEYESEDVILSLETLNFQIPLKELYENVDFNQA